MITPAEAVAQKYINLTMMLYSQAIPSAEIHSKGDFAGEHRHTKRNPV